MNNFTPPETRLATTIPAYALGLLPAFLGLIFIQLGIVYTGSLRPVIFEISWTLTAFTVVATAIIAKAPVIDEAKRLPRTYLAIFAMFAAVWTYTAIFVAPSPKMVYYYSGIAATAILLGLATAALRRRYGEKLTINISWALFAAMLLHAPFLVWLYVLEGQNLDFDWNYRLPGYPGLRMYNYSVEAGISAGLGLFYLFKNTSKRQIVLLTIGVALLWTLLFWGGGRGAFFALLATTSLTTIFVPTFLRRTWKFFIATLTLGAGTSVLLPTPNANFGLLGWIDQTFGGNSLNEISSGRLTVWSDAYDIFLGKPLFGHGAAQYPYSTTRIELTIHEHTHNIALESLVAFGIIGTLCLIFLLGKIWGSALLRLRNRLSASTLPAFLVATTLIVHGFVSGTFLHIHSVYMIALTLGLLLQNGNESQR